MAVKISLKVGAGKKKATKKRVKNGIHIFRNKNRELVYNITRNGRILIDSGESYRRMSDLRQAMKTVHLTLASLEVLGDHSVLHDETGESK